MKSVNAFFSVRLDAVSSMDELSKTLDALLVGPQTAVVVTPNPEILLSAREDRDFAKLLNESDLSLPDGFGVSLVHFLRTRRRLRRWPGIDAAEVLLERAEKRQGTVLLLGGKGGSASVAKQRLRKRFSGLRIVVAEDVCFRRDGIARDSNAEQRVNEAIIAFAPEIIFVGLGAPKQENWIARHRKDFPSVRIMMTVGGAFDIWSGRLRRAPKLLRAIGLEWLWRFAQEPRRIRRIFRAVILFPLFAIRERPVTSGDGALAAPIPGSGNCERLRERGR